MIISQPARRSEDAPTLNLDVESIIEYLGIFQAGQLITGPETEIMERDLQSHKNVVCFLARLRHDFDILAFIDVNMIS